MMPSHALLKTYLLLTLLAVASGLAVNLLDVASTEQRVLPPHSPDIFSVNYTKWTMDHTGLVDNRVFAAKMQHYNDDRSTDLTQPALFVYQEKQLTWQISAITGNVSADGKTVWLGEHAVLQRIARNDDAPALRINTRNVSIFPEQHYATTPDDAELVSLSQRTRGTGMKLTFKPPIRMELLARVQGHYEP